MNKVSEKVMVIGLDCLDPRLAFSRFREEMPNLSALLKKAAWGRLLSTIPAITVPAWMSMMTGRDPGQLGFYSFRDRASYDYDNYYIVNSRALHFPALWDRVGEVDGKSIVVGVPQTYPPRPISGEMVAGFLTPSKELPYTWPIELGRELDDVCGGNYIIDLENFRISDKEKLRQELFEMTLKRFQVIRHLNNTRSWDLFVAVDMGPDRLHHGFWRYSNSDHPLYKPGNSFEMVFSNYYRLLDNCLGQLVAELPPETILYIVSDHGAQTLRGNLAINEWLWRRGYLVLKNQAAGSSILKPEMVDWSRTKAWGEGGYFGKIFLNIKDREPEGIVAQEKIEELLAEISSELSQFCQDQGLDGTATYRPQDIYREVNGIPPDLIVYVGDLAWRCTGLIQPGGDELIACQEEDPDDANHAPEGIVIRVAPGQNGIGDQQYSIYDIYPSVLNDLGIPIENGLRGKVMASNTI